MWPVLAVADGCLALVNWSSVLDITIWSGFALLSLALLVLSLTRWGNVKTTHKCIGLSVFAHLLLVLYAYETRLFFPSAGSNGNEAIVPIHFVSESDTSSDFSAEEELKFAPQDLPLPNLAAPKLLEAHGVLESGSEEDIAVTIPLSIAAPSLLEAPEAPANDAVANHAAQDESNIDVQPAEPESIVESQPTIEPDTRHDSAATNVEADQVKLSPPSDSSIIPMVASTDVADSPKPANSSKSREVTFGAVQPTPMIYALRSPNQRRANALQRGGTEGTEEAVENALRWLANNQQTDGRWNPRMTEAGREFRVLGHDRRGAGGDADTALTGLALLAFMGAGYEHLHGDYRDNIRNGLEFILKSQSGSGHLAGEASLFAHMYSHSIATLAVSEAYALTGDQRLKPYVERAVAYSLAAQDPLGGGWRYQSREAGDMSQFGWQVMALKSAQLGGATIPSQTVERMKVFLESCSSGQYSGLASYRPRQQPSATMTAEALACRYFLGQAVATQTASEAADFILQETPGSGEVDYYLWYYATLSLYQRGGQSWETWNRQLQNQLTRSQLQDGNHAGSWEPNGKWCGYGGRVFSTSMATMSLEVYYRYLPLMREQVAQNRESTPRQLK